MVMFTPMPGGKLYMNDGDNTIELNRVGLADLTPCVEDESQTESIRCVGKRAAAVGTFEATFNPLTLWLLLTGRVVTNNWLKMHGGVMRRKGKR